MKRVLKAIITQHNEDISIQLQLDDDSVFQDGNHFINTQFANGYFSDIFHFLSSNRFKKPTEALPSTDKLLGMGK